jgi:hypothetical protein
MMRYPKLKTMMPGMPRNAAPGGTSSLNPAMKMPSMPMAPHQPSTVAFAAPGAVRPPSTLPSLQSTQNTATPIELGDPQRLGKIATLLRLGRK